MRGLEPPWLPDLPRLDARPMASIDQLRWLERGLLVDLHGNLLPVIQGRAGSCIGGGAVALVQPPPTGNSHRWPEPRILLDEVPSLGRALEARL